GMHAVEDYIMSRYQMYWQVYFHPVTRSAETILVKIFDRVKYLYQSGYTFNMEPEWLLSMFKESPLLEEYLRLDESVFHFYFLRWQEESDPILSDLCIRLMNRKLFKYVNIHTDKEKVIYEQLRALFKEASIDYAYYLSIDASSDLLYDVSIAGEGWVTNKFKMFYIEY